MAPTMATRPGNYRACFRRLVAHRDESGGCEKQDARPDSVCLVGLGRFELPTSPLSGVRSNQLSYRPAGEIPIQANCVGARTVRIHREETLGKEVIQPQVPLRLPCYDFTPVMNHTVVSALPKVKQPTSGAAHSHGVTGGVYKARERIHRSMLICDY